MPRASADSICRAVQWVTEARAAKWRHDRAMAFMFSTLGAKAFPNCETLLDVCVRCDLSERTMHAHLEVLRDAYGIRPPSCLPTDVLPEDFAAEADAEAA